MSEAAKVTAINAKPTAMHVLIIGRVEGVRKLGDNVLTKVITPAPDPYSRPQVVEINSAKRFAGRGDEIEVRCMLGGYNGKRFQVKDRETGEITDVIPVSMMLTLIED